MFFFSFSKIAESQSLLWNTIFQIPKIKYSNFGYQAEQVKFQF